MLPHIKYSKDSVVDPEEISTTEQIFSTAVQKTQNEMHDINREVSLV
mgnify:CR=1 FL=1